MDNNTLDGSSELTSSQTNFVARTTFQDWIYHCILKPLLHAFILVCHFVESKGIQASLQMGPNIKV